MSTTLSAQQRFDLITRGIEEVQDGDLIKAILAEGKNPRAVWATAPTGRPHIGYLVPFVKIADFVHAGLEVSINIGDIYAFCVNYKHSLEVVGYRAKYYQFVMGAALEAIGVPATRVSWISESSHHLRTKQYFFDQLRMCALATQSASRETGEELSNTTMLSPLLCPIFQALDEEYLGADIQFGGVDQRGLFAFGDNFLPKLGYKKRAHLMNPMLPGLTNGKMSASIPNSKIDCLETPDVVIKKISNVKCDDSEIAKNGILGLLKMVLMPISRIRLDMQGKGEGEVIADRRPFSSEDAPEGTLFTVDIRDDAKDGVVHKHYRSYEELEQDYKEKKLSLEELKVPVAKAVNQLLALIRKTYESNEEWRVVEKLAYSEPEESSPSTIVPYDVNFCYPVRDLSNDRIKLTPFIPSVHSASFFNHTNPHPEVYAHMPLGPFASPADFTVNFFDVVVRPNPTMTFYAVIDKTRPPAEDSEGALAGILAYMNTSTVNQSTEIGFVITFPPFQRTHVTSNAVGLLLQYALDPPAKGGLGMRRVQWQTSSANGASMLAAERMGFKKEGVLRWDRVFYGGGSKGKQGNGKQVPKGDGEDLGRDTVVYSICWDDWEEGGREKMVGIMERR